MHYVYFVHYTTQKKSGMVEYWTKEPITRFEQLVEMADELSRADKDGETAVINNYQLLRVEEESTDGG